jgi:hypothetical protein
MGWGAQGAGRSGFRGARTGAGSPRPSRSPRRAQVPRGRRAAERPVLRPRQRRRRAAVRAVPRRARADGGARRAAAAGRARADGGRGCEPRRRPAGSGFHARVQRGADRLLGAGAPRPGLGPAQHHPRRAAVDAVTTGVCVCGGFQGPRHRPALLPSTSLSSPGNPHRLLVHPNRLILPLHPAPFPKVDDLFLSTDSGAGSTYRATPADLLAHMAWQDGLNARLPANSSVRLELAFNGNGVLIESGAPGVVSNVLPCFQTPLYTQLNCSCWNEPAAACPPGAPAFCRACVKDWRRARGGPGVSYSPVRRRRGGGRGRASMEAPAAAGGLQPHAAAPASANQAHQAGARPPSRSTPSSPLLPPHPLRRPTRRPGTPRPLLLGTSCTARSAATPP